MSMKKKACEIKKGDRIKIAGKVCIVEETESSDIGKQGSKKCRMVAKDEKGERITLIRPEDYPIELA